MSKDPLRDYRSGPMSKAPLRDYRSGPKPKAHVMENIIGYGGGLLAAIFLFVAGGNALFNGPEPIQEINPDPYEITISIHRTAPVSYSPVERRFVLDSLGNITYTGGVHSGHPNGEGVSHNGRPHGECILTWENGARLVGKFKHGTLIGSGIFTDIYGTQYKTDFRDAAYSNSRNLRGHIATVTSPIDENLVHKITADGEMKHISGIERQVYLAPSM